MMKKTWNLSIYLENNHIIYLLFDKKSNAKQLKKMIEADYLRWVIGKEDRLLSYSCGEDYEITFDPRRFSGIKVMGINPDKYKQLQIDLLKESIKELKSKNITDGWKNNE